jgi:hypothetical protein
VDLVGAPPPPLRSGFSRQCLNHRRHQQRLSACCQRLPRLPSPSEELLWRQPMPTRNCANRLPAGYGLGDDPRLLLGAPCPPPTSPREDLDAPGILSVSTMLSDHSKPNGETDTEDSQNSWPRERWGQNSAYGIRAPQAQRALPGTMRPGPNPAFVRAAISTGIELSFRARRRRDQRRCGRP